MNEEELKENSRDILYRPDIGYDKKYDSTGEVDSDYDLSEDSDDETSILEDISDDIDSIKDIFPLLPDDMKDIVSKPLIVIEEILDDLDDIEKEPDSNGESIVVVDKPGDLNNSFNNKEDFEEDDDFYPEDIFINKDDPFKIITESKDKLTVIKDTYNYDMASIIADYVNKLSDVMNTYLNNILTAFAPLDSSMYSKVLGHYNAKSTSVNKDFRHLSDLILRSQITRNMKIRMYNKLFNLDKTITHIRTCKAGVSQRLRYYEADYQEETGHNDMLNNRFLENSRMMYDKKYKQNFFNLYKYLNSSVILLNECFQMYINEAQAKIILLMKEGNDLW